MQRQLLTPRPNWQLQAEQLGMYYHTADNSCYWDESACYRFNSQQIDTLDDVTTELHQLCLSAVAEIIRYNWFARLQIPDWAISYIISSWEQGDASLYGRFDLAWDGTATPKLLEYNADTPTALLEASVVQWFWLQDCFPAADQFNSIHEKLISFWQGYRHHHASVHFACDETYQEDLGNLEYLRDTAVQAGLLTERLDLSQIGWDSAQQRFVDMHNRNIQALFKLYPWEWMLQDEFARQLPTTQLSVLEPAWKLLLSNKGILAILWELFPDHPNLLAASFSENALSGDYVRKPLYSREGANVALFRQQNPLSTSGQYGAEGYVYQQYTALPEFSGNYPVIGAWVIAHQAAGIGIREDRTEITSNNSRFIPHYFSKD